MKAQDIANLITIRKFIQEIVDGAVRHPKEKQLRLDIATIDQKIVEGTSLMVSLMTSPNKICLDYNAAMGDTSGGTIVRSSTKFDEEVERNNTQLSSDSKKSLKKAKAK